MDYIPSFIARKNGSEEITYDIPVMEKYLKDTYGITVYQEQVMLLSRLLAGFTRGESDKLRKAMGKKQKAIVDEMKPKFIEGGKKNGYDPAVLAKIWGDWEKFASYAFNKSHAACYSWVAYQTAYLKANYPAEFMAAIMTRRKDDIKEITKLMDECRTMNIITLGPDVNESYAEFGVNKKGEIRFGLAAVKGMGEVPANAIIEEREKNGPYKNIYDFAERINYSSVNRRCFESLVYSGAFDSFGLRREQYAAVDAKGDAFLDLLIKYGNMVQNDKMNIMGSLFGDDEAASISKPEPSPCHSSGTNLELLNKEKSLIGIYLSAHPLDDYKVVLKRCVSATCQEMVSDNIIPMYRRGSQWTFGGIVTGVVERYTKRNTLFGVVKIEDFDGEGELRVFDQWSDVRNKFVVGCAVYVKVNLESSRWDPSRVNMRIESVKYLADAAGELLKKIHIKLFADKFCPMLNKLLADQVANHPGNATVIVSVIEPKTRTPVELQLKKGVSPTMDFIEGLENYDGVSVTIESE